VFGEIFLYFFFLHVSGGKKTATPFSATANTPNEPSNLKSAAPRNPTLAHLLPGEHGVSLPCAVLFDFFRLPVFALRYPYLVAVKHVFVKGL
jgi:hypothetical protein